MLLGFVGCKGDEVAVGDNSSIPTDSTASTNDTKVPIVIVDDEDASSTQSDIDQAIDDWENAVPNIEIEVNSSNDSSTDSSSDTVTSEPEDDDGDASETTSSEKDESDDSGSQEQGDENTSSEEENQSKPNRPDDGYFDVAV